jgi:hypothetical protein
MTTNEKQRLELEQRQMEAATVIGGDDVVCIGCGCTEACACPGGCYWISVDQETGEGICSTCVGVPILDLVGRRLTV